MPINRSGTIISRPIENRELTTREVADLLGFGQTAVLEWARRGHLPFRATPGGHRRYKLSDVEAFKVRMQNGGFGPHPLKGRGRAAERPPADHQPDEKKTLQKLGKILKKPGIKLGSKASK